MPARGDRRLAGLALAQGIGYLATFGWTVIAARVSALDTFGAVSLAASLVLAVQVLLEFGQHRALVRYQTPLLAAGRAREAARLGRRALVAPLVLGALLGVALAAWLAVAPRTSLAGLEPRAWALVLAGGLGAALTTIRAGACAAAGRAVASSVLGLAAAPLLLCVAFAWLGRAGPADREAMLVALALAYLLPGAYAAIGLLRGERGRGGGAAAAAAAMPPSSRDYARFAGQALTVGALSLGLVYADRYVLGAFASLAAVGLYSLPARTARLLSLPVYFLHPVAGPIYTRAAAGDAAALAVHRASARFVASLVVPAGLTAAVQAGPLLAVLGGASFAAAAPAMTILAAGATALALSGPGGLLLQMGGAQDDEVRAAGAGLAVNVAAAVALVGPLGITGVAAGTALGFAAVAAARWRACRARWGARWRAAVGRREVVAAVVYLAIALGGRALEAPAVGAVVATAACVVVVAPWAALADLSRALAAASERPEGVT